MVFILLFTCTTTPVQAGNVYTYTYTYNGKTVTSVNSASADTTSDTSDTTGNSNEPANVTTIDQDSVSDPTVVPNEDVADVVADDNSIPVADPDTFTTESNTSVTLDVLANDSNLDDLPLIVSIISPPENGQAVVEENNMITYTPNNDYTGTDDLLYKIADMNGDEAIASIAINIRCSLCLSDVMLTLTWNPNVDDVTGYAVYFGPSSDNVNNLASILPITSGLLNPEAPSIQYHLGSDLGLNQGDNVCFRLKAYNEFGFSDFSDAACVDTIINST